METRTPLNRPAIQPAPSPVFPALDHLEWSRWTRCESSFALLLVPAEPGVFALAEEITATADSPDFGCRRMLALLQVSAADDLARDLSRLFAVGSPWRDHVRNGRCFVRYVTLPDAAQRASVAGALQRWLAASVDAAAAHAPAPGKPSFPEGF